ncbi:MAG TPA: hypothetical protein VFH46_22580 [Pyrinomonadaceae bacterium]|nr:hypothetical protein [Pyrinomonadaceae bacterium]
MSAQTRELYVGPRPYEESNASIFFGREREARDLLSLVIANQLLLIYAPSGAGKTSLINARLVPMLGRVKDPGLAEQLGPGKGFEVLPIARVSGLVPETVDLDAIPNSNIFVFNTLVSWRKKDAGTPTAQERKQAERELIGKRLCDYLEETRPVAAPTVEEDEEEGEPLSPRVVIFDQFEEIFTRHFERWQDREGFFEQIMDALKGGPFTLRRCDIRRPAALISRILRGANSVCVALRERLANGVDRVLKDDSKKVDERLELLVSELNTMLKGESLYDAATFAGVNLREETAQALQQKRRSRSFLASNRALLEDAFPDEIYRRAPGDRALRVVFSMREDYIAELDPYTHLLPDRLGTRYRLDRLRRDAALAAVKNPLQFTHVSFAPGVAERLVDSLLQTPVRVATKPQEE